MCHHPSKDFSLGVCRGAQCTARCRTDGKFWTIFDCCRPQKPEIKHTEPGLKGNTATNASKPATLETGAIVNVPLFINEGDKIKVDTEKGHYIERIKIN